MDHIKVSSPFWSSPFDFSFLTVSSTAHKSPGKGGDDSAAKGVTGETGPDHPVETEEVGEPDEDTPETSEGKPGDEEVRREKIPLCLEA